MKGKLLKRLLIGLALIVSAVLPVEAKEIIRDSAKSGKPNILWIVLEDTSPYFGCYGDETNKGYTPTIDGLAEKGVMFTRCYMPAPVCSPCRSALIVGTMQTTTGTHQHRSARVNAQQEKNPQNLYPLPDPYKPIPQIMKEAGYHTFNAGKDDYNFTYDRRDLYSSGNPVDYQYPHNGWQGRFGYQGSWKDRKDKDQPWFGQIELAGGKSRARNLPREKTLSPGSVALPPYFPDTPAFHQAWTHHWNACRNVDLEVKSILNRLETDGEAENTIVFFFSDHGDNKSLRHKQFCYEGGVHVPFIVTGKHPLLPKGEVRTEIMSGLDISATTLALAGIEPPAYMDGRNLFSKDYQPREFVVSARDRCDYTIDRIRTIRTDTYRYIRNFFPERSLLQPQYRDGQQTVKDLKRLHAEGKLTHLQDEIFFGVRAKEELYDIERDPHQTNNLALDPAFEKELVRHREILTQWIDETDDKGQYPERAAEMRAQVRFWKGRTVNPEFDKYEIELETGTAVSPDGTLIPKVFVDEQGSLSYELKRGNTQIMQPSKMGISVDGVALGKGVRLESLSIEEHSGSFDWLGACATVENNYVAQTFELTQTATDRKWFLETRCYDSGFAFRYVVPGGKEQIVNSELTTWNLPSDAELWYRKNGGAFQTYWNKAHASEIAKNFNAQLNVTIELADGTYASLNEAGSFSFSGGSLLFTGTDEAQTVYAGDKDGWVVRGGKVVTPWRIVMAAKDLNELVNCNLTVAVCPAPNPALFPQGSRTEWLQPGRSLWQWWGYWNSGTRWEKQRWFIDNAAALGCQYYLVDEGWEHPAQGWVTKTRTAWDALGELADYGRERGVKLLVWRSYPASESAYYEGMETVQKRTAFYKNCKKAGVYGAKIDFLNSEDVEHSSFMHDCLAEAAGYELLVNFHGAPKPRGEERTYPNQVSREGVVGMEHNKWEAIPRKHYATSPFTRGVSGYVDFTVTTFQPDFLKGTTSASQLAQALVFTSPVLHWADKPQYYLKSQAVDLVRSMPTTWDETVVLPSSKIGVQAAFARRKGKNWYVGIINGTDDTVEQAVDLSFLGKGSFVSTLLKDVPGTPVEMAKEELTLTRKNTVTVSMSPGGGFVAVFRKLDVVPYGGPVYGKQTIELRFADGSDVCYTLDGSEPTEKSVRYEKPFTIKKGCNLRAKVIKGDGQGCDVSARFVALDVPMPEEDGDFILRGDDRIELMNLTEGEVYYTLDGSSPSKRSILYEGPIELDCDATLKAITIVNGLCSDVFEKRYVKQPEPAPLPQVKLSERKPLRATVGWDRLRINENLSGDELSVEGRGYESGILAHAPSVVEYRLEKTFTRFVAGMGIDDAKKNATVIFKVQVGDEILAESPVIRPGITWYFDVELPKDHSSIKLITEDAGDGNNSDHSAWVNAGFIVRRTYTAAYPAAAPSNGSTSSSRRLRRWIL